MSWTSDSALREQGEAEGTPIHLDLYRPGCTAEQDSHRARRRRRMSALYRLAGWTQEHLNRTLARDWT